MNINGESSVVLNNKSFWTVRQFSKLTEYSEPRIRSLMYQGNCIRKLKNYQFCSNKPLIHEEELFDFPFVLSGRPLKDYDGNCIKVKKFYLNEEGELSSREEIIER